MRIRGLLYSRRVIGIAGAFAVSSTAAFMFSSTAAASSPTGPAGGALSGTYPKPKLHITGGDNGASHCKNGQALVALSPLSVLTCGPGVYSDTHQNTSAGRFAFHAAHGGTAITALGDSALFADTGSFNTAIGECALCSNTGGEFNTAVGYSALETNTVAGSNTAIGANALPNVNFTGSNFSGDTALGENAGVNLLTGTDDVFLGECAGCDLTGSESNNIEIGNSGTAGDNNLIRIGDVGIGGQTKAFLAGVHGASVTDPANVVLNNSSGQLFTGTSGQVSLPTSVNGATSSSGVDLLINSSGVLGTSTSSRRFKTDIHPLRSIDGLLSLRPVTFHYKRQYIHGQPDPLEYGLIAEQVARVYPALVAYDNSGRPYTVRYQELPAMLLALAQRQQRQISSQQREINSLQAQINRIERRLGG
jgi:hypothetical protein